MNHIVDGYNVEIEATEIINDPRNYFMVDCQIYADKHVQSAMMQWYALLREFCFTVVRSSTTK